MDAQEQPVRWLKQNLVALGSAAVLTVYAAGYARTREAAARFSDEGNDRRHAAPIAEERPAATATPRHATEVAPAPKSARGSAPSDAPGNAPKASAKAEHDADAAAAPTQVASASHATDSVVPVVAPPPSPPAAPPSTPPVTNADTAQKADTTQQEDEKQFKWRDGTYSGWGTSRHGDIQAAVDIKNGRIVSAYITQCLTRYSCSWISMLPSQVVARQSAEVDFVSGATQSTNAFYYAISEALARATR